MLYDGVIVRFVAMPLKLFLFDLDGTLIDTAPTLVHAANRVLIDEGKTPLPLEVLRPFVSRGAPGMLGRGLGITTEHERFKALRADFLRYYAEDITTGTVLFDGISELLAGLRQAGIATGIVTNKPEALTRQLLKALEIESIFDVVLGFDSPHCTMKPSPDSLLEALRIMEVSATEAIYAGDDERDVLAAHTAQMRVASVAWGYSADDMKSWNADYHAQRPADLLAWAQRLQTLPYATTC